MIENTIYGQEDKLWLTVAVLWILVFEVLLVVRASPCFSNPGQDQSQFTWSIPFEINALSLGFFTLENMRLSKDFTVYVV